MEKAAATYRELEEKLEATEKQEQALHAQVRS